MESFEEIVSNLNVGHSDGWCILVRSERLWWYWANAGILERG
jgi:hypothetical protein